MIAWRKSSLRPSRFIASVFTGAAFSLALAAAVLVAPSPARAADDDVPLDTKILRGLLETLGLRKDGEAINYQERAPLVIPPNRTLPPPENPDAAIASNPDWPKDPDVQRAKEARILEREHAHDSADETIRREQRPLRPDEMTRGGKNPRMASGPRVAGPNKTNEIASRLSPSQLGYTGGLFNFFGRHDDETAKFTGEPARTSLTEPPPGYQTPSPDQPYGLTERTTAPKATNYLLEHGIDTTK
jgi:hypothetical protein